MTAWKGTLRRLVPAAAVFAVFMFINLGVQVKFDDPVFIQSFADHGNNIVAWASFFWQNWSSRVLISGLTVVLMSSEPLLFDLINALMQTAVVLMLTELALLGREVSWRIRTLLLVLVTAGYLYFIPYSIRMESDVWRVAAAIYLWGIGCALFCMRPFAAQLQKQACRPGVLYCVLAAVAAVYAAGCEQAAPVIVAFGLISQGSVLLRRQKPWAFGWVVIGLTLAVFLLCLTAPGNAKRTDTEILMNAGWYPATGFGDKLFYGAVAAVSLITQQLNILMLAVSLLVLAQLLRRNCTLWQKLCSALPCGYFGLSVFIDWYKANLPGIPLPGNFDYLLYDLIPTSPPAVSFALNQWFATALAFFVCGLLGAMLFFWLRREDSMYAGLLYAAAFADIFVVSFTVSGRFASMRTAFIPAVLLIAVFARLTAPALAAPGPSGADADARISENGGAA